MKKLRPLLFAFIIFFFTNCEKDVDTDEVTTNKNSFNFKTITFNEVAKINKKTSQKVLELKNDFLQKNAIVQGVLVDTTNIVHLQREDGFNSFSFKVQQDINLNHFQNLVIENFPNGKQRTLLVKFNLNTPLLFLDKQSISNATTSIEVTNLSNNTIANRGTGSDCITVGYYETVDACGGELVTPSENPRCFNADGTRATKEVFITLAEDCSDDGGGGDGGYNGNPDDPNNGGNDGSNGGGTYNGSGIFIPNIYNGDEDPTNSEFVLAGQVATYFNSLPQNIRSLTSNNTWVYAYLVDYFRNHGNTVNFRNTPNATTALNNFYTFQLSSYSPNLSHVAHEKLNFWAYYTFLNNNVANTNTQKVLEIKNNLLNIDTPVTSEIIDYLFDNKESQESIDYIKYGTNILINNPEANPFLGADCRSFEFAQPPGASQKACAVQNFNHTFYTAGVFPNGSPYYGEIESNVPIAYFTMSSNMTNGRAANLTAKAVTIAIKATDLYYAENPTITDIALGQFFKNRLLQALSVVGGSVNTSNPPFSIPSPAPYITSIVGLSNPYDCE